MVTGDRAGLGLITAVMISGLGRRLYLSSFVLAKSRWSLALANRAAGTAGVGVEMPEP